jgi:hypothetical protein
MGEQVRIIITPVVNQGKRAGAERRLRTSDESEEQKAGRGEGVGNQEVLVVVGS